MQLNDDVVSGWLSGVDNVDGHENPAGSFYVLGQAATEAALASPDPVMITGGTTTCTTTVSVVNHCLCC